MKASSLLTVAFCLAAAPAFCADPGRGATIHLRTGKTLDCVVFGFKDGKFDIEEKASGKRRGLYIARIEKIAFGTTPGEVTPEPIKPPEKNDEPKAPAVGLKQLVVRGFGKLIAVSRPGHLVIHLLKKNQQLPEQERLKKVDEHLELALKQLSADGEAEKKLVLALTISKALQRDRRGAQKALDDLKGKHPEDKQLQATTLVRLMLGFRRDIQPWVRLRPEWLPRLRPIQRPGPLRPRGKNRSLLDKPPPPGRPGLGNPPPE